MSSDVFEKNVSGMVRRAALRPDAGRARERFLRGIDAPEERRSWKIAAAAAALLVVVTVVWSAKTPPMVGKSAKETPAPSAVGAVLEPQDGKRNELLKCRLRLPPEGSRKPVLHLLGSSTLPDGLLFKVHLHRKRERFSGGRLEETLQTELTAAAELRNGTFDLDWESKVEGPIRVDVSAPDDLQEREMVKRLKVPASERTWSFEYFPWDDRLLGRLRPQAQEVWDLVDEFAQELEFLGLNLSLDNSEPEFRRNEKELLKKVEQIRARAEGLARSGLYPAASEELGFIARNLAVSMPNFKWENGKFLGPMSYYSNGKVDKTHRNEPFSLQAIQRYVREVGSMVGRELELWIVKDARRAGFREEHADLVRETTRRLGGVTAFAERLKKNDPTLEAEIRQVVK